MTRHLTRRGLLAGAGYGLIAGTTGALALSPGFRNLALGRGEALSYRVHRLIGRDALAREYSESEMSPVFRTNGSVAVNTADYKRWTQNGFADWSMDVGGKVAAPASFSLDDLRAMPARTQITRHDCVEGWSAIGKWSGVPLHHVLERVRPTDSASFVVFHCADQLGLSTYYESIDMVDALHPQTILAYGMNDADLPMGHGAPLRLRVERQLGYKHAKFIKRIELVDSLAGIGGGKGGFWEDFGDYDWYAGI